MSTSSRRELATIWRAVCGGAGHTRKQIHAAAKAAPVLQPRSAAIGHQAQVGRDADRPSGSDSPRHSFLCRLTYSFRKACCADKKRANRNRVQIEDRCQFVIAKAVAAQKQEFRLASLEPRIRQTLRCTSRAACTSSGQRSTCFGLRWGVEQYQTFSAAAQAKVAGRRPLQRPAERLMPLGDNR
jgi:hypothetical protein